MKTEFANETPVLLEIEESTPAGEDNGTLEEYIFLIGRPPLQQFLNFVTETSSDKQASATRVEIEDWHIARERVRELQQEESGWADNPVIGRLDSRLEPLRRMLHEDPLFRNSFSMVRTQIGIVELDRLVVYQKHINLGFARRLKEGLSNSPSNEEVFRFCLPFDHPKPPVKWMRTGRHAFTFLSPSNDLRYLGTMFLQQEHIVGQPPPGTIVGVVGLAVGFGSNFLNAIHVENRLVLNNGSHRAFALRDLGITHAPCIIQQVSTREELDIISSSDLKRNPERYLDVPRPPVLKDYFDAKLRKVVQLPKRLRQVRVKFGVDHTDSPDL